MRTIKFRGKRIDNGQWIYGSICQGLNGGYSISPKLFFGTVIFLDDEETEWNQEEDGIALGGWFAVEAGTEGQFTGVLDKHGKEVYENDIIRPLNGGNAVVKIGLAEDMTVNCGEYSVDFYGVYLDIPETDVEDRTWYEHWEVKGNIHDNPELLS